MIVAELGSAGVLLDTGRPAAAYLNSTALGWLRGRPPAAEHQAQHAQCFARWRAAGFITPGDQASAPTGHGDVAVEGAACAGLAPHPVLVLAMAADCGFCTQLSADLAANTRRLTRLDASVLLVDADGTSLLGRPLSVLCRQQLAGLGQCAAKLGTPSGVLLTPGQPTQVLVGFTEVSGALVALSGADPRTTIVEAPTSCSVNVAAQPVDAVLTARVNGTRLGIAVRGHDAREIAEASGAVLDDGYTPVTLTIERPGTFHLLFRGGELLTRARTPHALRQTLDGVLAGYARYASPERGNIPLLCGVAVHGEEHAVLFPRTWMSDLVKHARRLEQTGWQLRPEPYTLLRPAPGTGVLHLPAASRPRQPGPAVTAILTQAPQTGTPPTRAWLLASIVNWLARPAAIDTVHSLVASLEPLPIHIGTWQEALAHLTRPTAPEDDSASTSSGSLTT
ncbi:hypothetical protein ACIGXM_21215 [Kitasatospora sp. NPDC052896]|uniref:hypothetical protein n=1 Tax=Kitasatospora sp. NPDC052896 TaxID=3364061 RepID=UPI0037C57BF3